MKVAKIPQAMHYGIHSSADFAEEKKYNTHERRQVLSIKDHGPKCHDSIRGTCKRPNEYKLGYHFSEFTLHLNL